MTHHEADNILHTFASLIEIRGLPDRCIQDFHEAYELGIKSLKENQRIRELFENANDADDFYHEVRILFEGE